MAKINADEYFLCIGYEVRLYGSNERIDIRGMDQASHSIASGPIEFNNNMIITPEEQLAILQQSSVELYQLQTFCTDVLPVSRYSDCEEPDMGQHWTADQSDEHQQQDDMSYSLVPDVNWSSSGQLYVAHGPSLA